MFRSTAGSAAWVRSSHSSGQAGSAPAELCCCVSGHPKIRMIFQAFHREISSARAVVGHYSSQVLLCNIRVVGGSIGGCLPSWQLGLVVGNPLSQGSVPLQPPPPAPHLPIPRAEERCSQCGREL